MSTINTSDTGWTVPVASRLTMHGITYIPKDQLEEEQKKRLSQVAELTAERDKALTSLSWYRDDPDVGYSNMWKQTTLAGLTAGEIRELKSHAESLPSVIAGKDSYIASLIKQRNEATERAGKAEASAKASSGMYDSMQRERDEARAEKDSLDRAHRRVIENLVKERDQARKDITYQSGCIHELQEAISKLTKEHDKAKAGREEYWQRLLVTSKERDEALENAEKARKEAAYLRMQGQIDKVKDIANVIGIGADVRDKHGDSVKSGFDFQEAYENLVETHSEVVHMLHRAWNERDEALGRLRPTEATINIRSAA